MKEKCEEIDLTKEQVDEILATIQDMVEADSDPETVVEYLSSELGFPVEDDDEYCTMRCVSSCLYEFYKDVGDEIYAYVTHEETYAEITECFPVFEIFESGCCKGSVMSRGCSKNTEKAREKSKGDNKNMLSYGLNFLKQKIEKYFALLVAMCISYIESIKIKDKYLVSTVRADITKKIGAAFSWIAKAWKSIKDMYNSAINWVFSAEEAKTDEGEKTEGHFKKAIQDALTTVQGYITDMMKDVGDYIEQIGDLLYDYADQVETIGDITFKWKALNDNIQKYVISIDDVFNEIMKSEMASKIYDDMVDHMSKMQIEYTKEMDLLNARIVDQVDEVIENAGGIRDEIDGAIDAAKKEYGDIISAIGEAYDGISGFVENVYSEGKDFIYGVVGGKLSSPNTEKGSSET